MLMSIIPRSNPFQLLLTPIPEVLGLLGRVRTLIPLCLLGLLLYDNFL